MHNQFRAACIFVAVILVSVVQAEALSSDERAALESQLAESRAENERLRGQNEQLRVKINVLHAQVPNYATFAYLRLTANGLISKHASGDVHGPTCLGFAA